MRIWIGFRCSVKSLEYQRVVIVITDDISNNAAIVEVEYGAEIYFVYFNSFIPFEFCYICEPLLIRLFRIELTIQKILSQILRILRPPCTAAIVVLNSGLDASGTADAQYALVVGVNSMVMPQFVVDTTVAFIRTFKVNLFYLFRDLLIFNCPTA